MNLKKWSDIQTEVIKLRSELKAINELCATLKSNSAFSWRVRALTTAQRDTLYPTPFDCLLIYNTTLTLFQLYYNGVWRNIGTLGAIDHGADLVGLADDDHPQYLHLNKAAQTILQNILVQAGVTIDGVDISAHAAGTAMAQHVAGVGDHSHQTAGAQGGQIDHGAALTAASLLDNDHTQYVNAVSDTASLDLTLAAQSISGAVLPGGVDHASLNNLNSANYTHLTAVNHTDLTDGNETTLHKHVTAQINIPNGVGSPTYDDVYDWFNNTRSAGRITGGVLTATLPADGTVTISAMEGMIFTVNALGSPLVYFKKAAVTNVTPADGFVSWIYYDYTTNAYATTTDRLTVHEYDQFVVGRCWRSGTYVEVQTTGFDIYNIERRVQNRNLLKYGNMDYVSGAIISAHATALRLQSSAGSWYSGVHDYTTAAKDTFQVWYKSGAVTWIESAAITLFSDIFNGAAATIYETYQNGNNLGTLTGNHYGVYWIFICPEGDLYVVLGTSSYATIGLAQASSVPTTLPPYLVNWGRFIGRVIVKKTAAAFYSVETIFTTQFTQSLITDHSSLADLTADDHTQYYLVSATRAAKALVHEQTIATSLTVAAGNTMITGDIIIAVGIDLTIEIGAQLICL